MSESYLFESQNTKNCQFIAKYPEQSQVNIEQNSTNSPLENHAILNDQYYSQQNSNFPQDSSSGKYNIYPLLLNYVTYPGEKFLTPEEASWNFVLPLFGRVRLLKDKMGLVCSFITFLYWVFGNWSIWLVVLLPRYKEDTVTSFLLILYGTISVLCLTSFLKCLAINPGALSNLESPNNDWSLCAKCNRMRPPGAHHCRKCGHCVRKMDHHCPWINNCVGEDNQGAFMQCLFYAHLLSLTALILSLMHIYTFASCTVCNPNDFMVIHEKAIIWTAVILAALMTMGGFSLYVSQHLSILIGIPSMEWNRYYLIYLTTGKFPIITFPKELRSVMETYSEVCGNGSMLCWLFPCHRRQSISMKRQFDV